MFCGLQGFYELARDYFLSDTVYECTYVYMYVCLYVCSFCSCQDISSVGVGVFVACEITIAHVRWHVCRTCTLLKWNVIRSGRVRYLRNSKPQPRDLILENLDSMPCHFLPATFLGKGPFFNQTWTKRKNRGEFNEKKERKKERKKWREVYGM